MILSIIEIMPVFILGGLCYLLGKKLERRKSNNNRNHYKWLFERELSRSDNYKAIYGEIYYALQAQQKGCRRLSRKVKGYRAEIKKLKEQT